MIAGLPTYQHRNIAKWNIRMVEKIETLHLYSCGTVEISFLCSF